VIRDDTTVRTTSFVVPTGIDDPKRPSGGNIYDRRLSRGLVSLGWKVIERAVPGSWPDADDESKAVLAAEISAAADGSVVLLDGLIASASPEVLVPAAARLRLVVLVHMLLGVDHRSSAREAAVLGSAAAIVVTSHWTRDRLLQQYSPAPKKVVVAEPGVDPAAVASGTATGGNLLCVAVVAPHKGQDIVVSALSRLADLEWSCTFVGALDRDPEFVDRIQEAARTCGIAERLRFMGPLTGPDLETAYADADVLLLASQAETYGMVVAEALARGIPVLGSGVGGVPTTLGRDADGRPPGVLVPAGDAAALAAALRCWLTDPDRRRSLRAAGRERRTQLTGWSVTSSRVAGVLEAVMAR
jgi:glycosyltransferase involved in cell wall biosynthesis